MTPVQISDFLRTKVGLSQDLSNDRLTDLVKGARVVSYEPNEAVVEFGEEASFLGVLLKGELSASAVGDGGQRQVLGQLKAAAAFRQSEDPYGLRLKGERPEDILVINCGSSSLK